MAATISTNPLNITYKQYDAAPTNVEITFSTLNNSDLSFGNVPSWLAISAITEVDSTTVTALFTINTAAANVLSEGVYNVSLDVYTAREFPDEIHGNFYYEGSLNVNLTYTETVLLEVAPQNVSFNYTSGGTLPSSKIILVASENNWTVDKSVAWISLSATSGSEDGSFEISVDPSGLATATHTGTVTVDDGTEKVINVTLVVTDGNDLTDYLYVSPIEIEFVKNIGSALNPTKNIYLNASETWNAVSSETWLDLSKATGSSGSDVITLSLDLTGLAEGIYTAEVAITAGSMLRKTYVTLHLNTSIVDVPVNGSLNFANDDVQLQLSTEVINAFLDVDFKSVTETDTTLYNKKAPYIKGVASVNIGEECENFITPVELPDAIASKLTTLLKPALLSFTAYEKNYFTTELLDAVERNTLYFLNGKTPITVNKLCYVPSEITVSRKAILALHVYKTINPGAIVISGSVDKTITLDDSEGSNIYTAFINLNELNINELDVLIINFDFLQITVRIKEEQAESVMLAFENEWQLPEFFELSGEVSISNNTNYATQKLQRASDVVEKIYEAKPNETFSFYTGYIESVLEVDWLEKINNSKRMYVYINSKKIEVIPTFKSLETYTTRDHQKNYRLTFKKAIT